MNDNVCSDCVFQVYWFISQLPPANKVCEGYVFTPVCHFVHGGYLGLIRYTPPAGTPPWAGTPPGRHTPWQVPSGQVHPPARYTPWQCMLGYGQQAGGTHPTGMHSCFIYLFCFRLLCARQRLDRRSYFHL